MKQQKVNIENIGSGLSCLYLALLPLYKSLDLHLLKKKVNSSKSLLCSQNFKWKNKVTNSEFLQNNDNCFNWDTVAR